MAGTIRRAIDAEEQRCADAGLVVFGAVVLPAVVAAGIRGMTRANPAASDSNDRPKLVLRPSVWLPGSALMVAIGMIELVWGDSLRAFAAFAIATGACLFMGLIWATHHR